MNGLRLELEAEMMPKSATTLGFMLSIFPNAISSSCGQRITHMENSINMCLVKNTKKFDVTLQYYEHYDMSMCIEQILTI